MNAPLNQHKARYDEARWAALKIFFAKNQLQAEVEDLRARLASVSQSESLRRDLLSEELETLELELNRARREAERARSLLRSLGESIGILERRLQRARRTRALMDASEALERASRAGEAELEEMYQQLHRDLAEMEIEAELPKV